MGDSVIDGVLYANLISRGTTNLSIHSEEVNNLNVFPIPDGDTGSNMLATMLGGKNAIKPNEKNLSSSANSISNGMLLSARGNSGVILSQFFDGISAGFTNLESANLEQVKDAFKKGVKHAYEAVMQPVEGTILTVMKDATEFACSASGATLLDFIEKFIEEAERSLERTPDLLPILKKSGVIDSGGAGLIYIVKGMKQYLKGENLEDRPSAENATSADITTQAHDTKGKIDIDAFTSDSVLEFGYCTELLLRLQNAKTNVDEFSVETIKAFLNSIGNSVVAFKTGSIIKLHVHTMTPDKVLAFCQQFGEFLTVKIENMSLQHNNIENYKDSGIKIPKPAKTEKKKYGVVAVAMGGGIKKMFLEHGADYVIEGGQTMNPSAENFLTAFNEVAAETIFVFPNNGNVILTAKQAAKMYDGGNIIVIETSSIGQGYAALTMMDTTSNDLGQITENFNMAIAGVATYLVSHCVRNANMDGISMKNGDYIGFMDKKIIVATSDRKKTAIQTAEAIDFTDHEVCILLRGIDSTKYECEAVKKALIAKHPGIEVYEIDGEQDVYSYIFIVE